MAERSGFAGVLNSSTTGLPLIGIECTVYDANDDEAVIYTTKNGGSTISQPIVTSSGNGGLIQFWTEPGYYEIGVEDTEIPARITPRRIPFNAVAGDVAGIAGNQIDTIKDEVWTGYAYGTSTITIGSIPPGKYIGMLVSDSAAKQGITVNSGSATITNSMPPGAQIVSFILTVTSTATIGYMPETSSRCSLTLYGIKN